MTERQKKEDLPTPEEVFKLVGETPLSDVLIETFKTNTNPSTWEVKKKYAGFTIEGNCGDPQDENDKRGLKLEKFYNDARLMVYMYKSDIFGDEYWGDLNFVSSVMEAGTWTADRGNLQTFGINVNLRNSSLVLPNQGTVWLLNIAAEVANEAYVRYEQNQPHFWDLQSKYRKPNEMDRPKSV